jgi:hypothetical protein
VPQPYSICFWELRTSSTWIPETMHAKIYFFYLETCLSISDLEAGCLYFLHLLNSTMLFSILAITMLFFIRQCAAVCCKNYNVLCIINSIDCTPNCSDGISRCDLNSQVCRDDSIGGCIDIITKTTTISFVAFNDVTTFTSYTATSDQTVATITDTETESSTSIQMITSYAVVTNVSPPLRSQKSAVFTKPTTDRVANSDRAWCHNYNHCCASSSFNEPAQACDNSHDHDHRLHNLREW